VLRLAEAVHLANLMCASGYVFPIDDHILTVKNDGAYYRFQARPLVSLCTLCCLLWYL